MKTKYHPDDGLSLKKTLERYNIIIIVKSVFHEDSKYYTQVLSGECLYKLRMLKYDKIDVNKTIGYCECIIRHYWIFLKINFRFQPKECDGCHDLMQNTMSFINVAIVSIKGNDCRIHFIYMSKDEAINLLRNADWMKTWNIKHRKLLSHPKDV